ncbi:MAG: hypothetical protein AUJ85_03785 [Elusimicrobia bacterium CG1_02_37_114]|nr:MAG: hypothetical protein AUJ85_03785 [Elusimicrobia bacterium CG1_02_37_114]
MLVINPILKYQFTICIHKYTKTKKIKKIFMYKTERTEISCEITKLRKKIRIKKTIVLKNAGTRVTG